MGKRILHVVGGMNRGGIETWLMHILRNIDRDRWQMDFLVHTSEACAYDDEIYSLGSQIIPCLHPSKPLMYAANFQQILGEYGPYDIIHSHVHHFSGYILRLAQQAGIATRIAHGHNDTSAIEAKAGLSRQFYVAVMKRWIAHYATVGLGCSRQAMSDLFGSNWQTDSRWQLLYYGIDLNFFTDVVDAVAVRAELGIPQDAFVIGHVGRFHPQKNHDFLLEITAEVAKRESKTFLLLIGEGELQTHIQQKAAQMNLSERILFAGSRGDVPRLMRGAMDAFVFPSFYEGLGIVLIEAQAAGLHSIYTDTIPAEADLVQPLIRRFSLSQSASEWANALLVQRQKAPIISQADALAIVQESVFSIATSLQDLCEIYQAQIYRETIA
ncbi:glycosyltransferase family 1 protein [Nodularia sphaerocarpa]|uniref:glycosyltransferase family 1 protein n=1 Tax=Nodularia sphaerocarpa TaxID=137816 RepID=UPI001EFB2B81|nr:glycosyltransferase family 1 protein [Nodularia sphaerocarpa]MDB9374353.1 glycosyltransferase family 1 protein [Nodularia sphaerocarpa CS-585]MDB9377396.1 glycosyltransferase family 1 protein [Nodularia sphaerocarpa CS-585A2]ULP70389.1 Putative glycosyltransferase EpsF [Nodularia sphaerocarpa UHCC 0038]